MKRREFIKQSIAMGAALSTSRARVYAAPEDYTGRFFVTLQADGAWDVSSFCDPKTNQNGEPEINTWSRTQGIQTAGNINYAPFGNNAAFFQKYYADTLVINGIDAQTNSHSTGVLHNWSGRNSAGYPSLTALYAAINAPNLPLAYVNFGGYAETSRLIRYTRLNDINSLIGVLTPNTLAWDRDSNYRDPDMLSLVMQRQQERLARMRQRSDALPRKQYAMDAYYQARASASGLEDFATVIPDSNSLEGRVQVNNDVNSSLRQQIQILMLAFSSGVACSGDLVLGGFDTHADHDAMHSPLLAHMTDSIDYFWTYAEALGIADRITLLVASDFSRTPNYNSSNGKDHWPIGSALLMEMGASWGNRVVGATDGGQNALQINPTSLAVESSQSSTVIYPKHLHKALRNYLGIDNSALANPFPFNNTEDIAFFS